MPNSFRNQTDIQCTQESHNIEMLNGVFVHCISYTFYIGRHLFEITVSRVILKFAQTMHCEHYLKCPWCC